MKFQIEGMDELLGLLDDLESDLTSLGMLPEEHTFVNLMTDVVAENFSEVWDSQGAAIGEFWNGRTLVKSGNLRGSYSSPTRLRVSVQGDTITFGSNVSYAPYVNDMYTFQGITQSTSGKVSGIVDKWLQENAKLQWN
tara:strand:+ start:1907 stop:2320 length:414 start_codon:yes stop_codon:yes gene_type:complete